MCPIWRIKNRKWNMPLQTWKFSPMLEYKQLYPWQKPDSLQYSSIQTLALHQYDLLKSEQAKSSDKEILTGHPQNSKLPHTPFPKWCIGTRASDRTFAKRSHPATKAVDRPYFKDHFGSMPKPVWVHTKQGISLLTYHRNESKNRRRTDFPRRTMKHIDH